MNFLSHFYFDRHTVDSHLVLGCVMPDLVKNAHKNWSLHPAKYQEALQQHPVQRSIFAGWQRHLAVDKYFHTAEFFRQHTQKLKQEIRPFLSETPVWASFLAHISLELLLDSLLITENLIQVDHFYHHLKKTDHKQITYFLKINQIEDSEPFFKFFNDFVESRYLNSYRDEHQVVYALNRISMRLWPDGLNAADREGLGKLIAGYKLELKKDFKQIFDEIETHLHTN